MRTEQASMRGRLVRELMQNLMETSMGHPFQTGEYRKNPVEPAWVCPLEYKYEIVDAENCRMEYLCPVKAWTGRVVLQLHGGGYIGPMKNAYRDFAVRYSELSLGGDVLTVDYRVAPEYPYPAALMDALSAYRWLTETKKYKPSHIVFAGDSAGGGLAFALMLYLRDHGYALPAGIIAMSPWTDLTCSGESHTTNFTRDPQFGNSQDTMLHNSCYIGDADPQEPYLSPRFGNFEGCPPVLMQVGSYEVLLDDTLSVADKLKEAGVKRRVSVYEGMFHVFQMAMDLLPESRQAWNEAGRFLQLIYGIRRGTDGKPVRMIKTGRRKGGMQR